MAYFKTSGPKKLETPEAGNSPTITADLKKLAEQIDIKVRSGELEAEAVTTAAIKLLAITEGLLATEAVTATKIKSEAVINGKLASEAVSDAKIITGRALLATTNNYSEKTFTKAEAEAGVSPSSTRTALVTMLTTSSLWEGTEAVFVNGARAGYLGEIKENKHPSSTTVWVPPGQKWKCGQPVVTFTILL